MDKKIPALFVVAALSSEIVTHHEIPPPPHVEPEIKLLLPSPAASISSSGGGTRKEALGSFRGAVLYSNVRRTGLMKGETQKVAVLEGYFETAKAIMENYPNLKKWERAMQYGCLKYQINRYLALTGGRLNSSDALPIVANALKLTRSDLVEHGVA
jgi:hypothetical protein